MRRLFVVSACVVCALLSGRAEDPYVEGAGGSYASTGYCMTPRSKVVIDFAFTQQERQTRLFGMDSADKGLTCCLYISNGDMCAWALQDRAGNFEWTEAAANAERRVFTLDSLNGTWSITGTGGTSGNKITTARTQTATVPLAILGTMQRTDPLVATSLAYAKVYSMQIYENGALVHDFRPCRYGTDGAFRDARNGTFHPSLSAVPFTCGGDGLPEFERETAADLSKTGGLVEAYVSGNDRTWDVWPFRSDHDLVVCSGARKNAGEDVFAPAPRAQRPEGTWAPDGVYRKFREANADGSGAKWLEYPFTGLVPGATYTIDCHGCETYFHADNTRVMSVACNGEVLGTDLDLHYLGGSEKNESKLANGSYLRFYPAARTYTAKANAAGEMIVRIGTVKDGPHVGGIALWGASAPSAVTGFAVDAVAPNGTQPTVTFSWNASADVHRYYLESADSATGPWTGVECLYSSVRSVAVPNFFTGAKDVFYRLVASNGVGRAVSAPIAFTATGTASVQAGTLVLDASADISDATDPSDFAQVVKAGPARVTLTAGGYPTAAIRILSGELRIDCDADVTLPANMLVGRGTFVKGGKGRLILQNLQPDFFGTIRVAAGALVFNERDTNTLPNQNLVVAESGARIERGAYADNNRVNQNLAALGGVTVENTSVYNYNALRNGTFAGDNTFDASKRYDFRNGWLDLGSGTLTKTGGDQFGLCHEAVSGEGATVDVTAGIFCVEGGTRFDGTGTIHVGADATLLLYNSCVTPAWMTVLESGAKIKVQEGKTTGFVNHFGPLQLNGDVTLSCVGDNARYSYIDGPVSGTGKLTVELANSGARVELTGTNTFTGGLELKTGKVFADSPAALPGWDDPAKLKVVQHDLVLETAEEGGAWTMDQIRQIANSASMAGDNAGIGINVPEGQTRTVSDDFALPRGNLEKYGLGTLVMAGNASAPRALQDNGGTLRLSGGVYDFARYCMYDDARALVIENATAWHSTTGYESVLGGNAFGLPPVYMTVSNSLFAMKGVPALKAASSSVKVGSDNNAAAQLRIVDSVVTNAIMVGRTNKGAQGAVIQENSFVKNWGGYGRDAVIGEYGYGFYQQIGGTNELSGYTPLARYPGSRGVFHMLGGYLLNECPEGGALDIGRDGDAVYYQAGGVVAHTNRVQVGSWTETKKGGSSVFTITGEGTVFDGADRLAVGERTNHTAIANINHGATLRTTYIDANSGPGGDGIALDTIKSYVNFDGGIYQWRAKNNGEKTENIFNDTHGKYGVDAVTIFEGGATFDIPAEAPLQKIGAPLTRPTGLVIDTITFSPNAATKYIGAPFVKISGGGGFGASATASYDWRSASVDPNLIVTSRGSGYTSAPTVTVQDGGVADVLNATVKMRAASATGGIVKRGAGALVLNAQDPNTFGGVLRVEGGELAIGRAHQYPAGNGLEIAGGTFNGKDFKIDAGHVRATEGRIANADIAAQSFTKTGPGTVVLGDGVRLGLKDPAAALAAVPNEVDIPGLYQSLVAGKEKWDVEDPRQGVSLGTPLADTTDTRAGGGMFPFNHTAIYSGYIWNRSDEDVTWSFAEQFDDAARLRIDDRTVFENAGWNTPTAGTVTLTPGAHAFELRLSQGEGGVGPSTGNGWNSTEIGFGIDRQGRGSKVASDYEKPVDPGDGSLFTTGKAGDMVRIMDGTVQVGERVSQVGLYCALLNGTTRWNDPNPCDRVEMNVDYANTTSTGDNTGTFPYNKTAVYSGYIWNRSNADVTWSFCEQFDDAVVLRIDGEEMISNSSWNTPTVTTVTLTPGAHAFDLRLSQGTGGVGPSTGNGWGRTDLGFGIDRQGRGTTVGSNYVRLVDPGDGSLFTTGCTEPGRGADGFDPSSTVYVAEGATLRYAVAGPRALAGLAGCGTVENADIKVTEAFIANADDMVAQKTLRIVDGKLDVSALKKIRIVNVPTDESSLKTFARETYTLVEATGGLTGSLGTVAIEGFEDESDRRGWRVVASGGRLAVGRAGGFTFFLR